MNKLDFGKLIHSLCKHSSLLTYMLIPVIKLKDIGDKLAMHKNMDDRIARYCPADLKSSPRAIKKLKRDMWYHFLRYNCLFSEYFMFQFYRLNHKAKTEFVTEYEKIAACRSLSPAETREIFRNKWKAYQRFAPFYKRDALLIDENTSLVSFQAFIEKHSCFIVKPLEESCGFGIRIIDTPGVRNAESLFASLQQEHVLVEQLIVQDSQMSRFHSSSVNTVRFATFLKDGAVHPLFAVLRIGMGSSIVDNAGAGGLIAAIDLDTGIVTTPGRAESGYTAIVHPDSGTQIIGAKIPQWEQAVELATQLAMVVPEQPYVGWDLALTESGWVMVEGNSAGQFVLPQITTQRGIRSLLSQYFNL